LLYLLCLGQARFLNKEDAIKTAVFKGLSAANSMIFAEQCHYFHKGNKDAIFSFIGPKAYCFLACIPGDRRKIRINDIK
jgi:uncharacterized protein (DUF111 family)